MSRIDKTQITTILNEWGLLDGLLYLEKCHHLELNKNLFLRYFYKNLEQVQPYFQCEEKWMMDIALNTLFPYLHADVPVSLELECALKEMAELKKQRIFLPERAWLRKMGHSSEEWTIEDERQEIVYLFRHVGTKMSMYEGQKWVVYFSFSAWEKCFNLLSIFPIEITGETEECEREENRALHQTQIDFLELVNTYSLLKIYQVWKGVSRSTFPLSVRFFHKNPVFKKYMYGGEYPDYFAVCKDLVLGPGVLCAVKGIDRANLEWSVRHLIERMVFPLRYRVFECMVQYNVESVVPLAAESSFILGESTMGQICLGNETTDSWSSLSIHVVTPSPEVYVLFYPGGKADRFFREVLKGWLDLHGIEANLKFTYTGDPKEFPFVPGGHLAILGHTTYLCEMLDHAPETYERCFDLKPLLKRFEYETL